MNPLVSSVKQLLKEAYEGTPTQSWFSDHGAGSGLFATLTAITAADASRTLVTGGSSIAGHTNHLRWSLAMSNALMRGEQPSRDWAESWVVSSVDDAACLELQNNLWLEYDTLQTQLETSFDPSNPMMTTVGIALVAHAAYHLSAIRQMSIFGRQS